ncbi:flagellar protein FliT [Paenalcaligenes suwonensis]|uniref:flagellar protein FliT n=1 Tax=Paenalcaligenes suwonensis TaxID=1202713 RepID=UPI001408E28F|nr:flagellar protein FliT [Paenalcaligenes suwonensis]NHC61820.1 flagellar protein FliT [Paenalcaligenes suwonensis]
MNTTAPTLLQQYETIANITSNMLQQAQLNAWDEVLILSERYIEAVDCLRTLDSLSGSDKDTRRELLTRILEDDAQIRHLATPELKRLDQLLGNMKRQQNILQTYYPNTASHS